MAEGKRKLERLWTLRRFHQMQIGMTSASPIFRRTCPGPGSGTGTSRSSGGFCHPVSWKAFTSGHLILDAVDIDEQMARAAEDIATPVLRRVDHEARILDTANKGFQCDVHLKARERTTEASMDAAAPAEVLIVRAFRIEFVRLGEPERIAVRRAVNESDRGCLGNCGP